MTGSVFYQFLSICLTNILVLSFHQTRNGNSGSYSHRVVNNHQQYSATDNNDTNTLSSSNPLSSGVSVSKLGSKNTLNTKLIRQSSYSTDDRSSSFTAEGRGDTVALEAPRPQRSMSTSTQVTSSRRKVVRLLVIILVSFAVCVLPLHVKNLLSYFKLYQDSWASQFLSPIAFICLYLHSALNPVFYCFFSESFRSSLKEYLRHFRHRRRPTTLSMNAFQ